MNQAIAIVFSLLVLLAATYAFSPRPAPLVPPREIDVKTLLLLDAAQAGRRLIAVGERGHIVLSDDQGNTWRPAASPTQATLTSVHFHDAQTGWAVGHDSVILMSRDGGATWRLVHSAPELNKPLLQVLFSDARHGIAIGAYGLYLQTDDGGATWLTRQIIDGDAHLNAFATLRDGLWFIAGEAGTLLRSADQGQTWQALTSPYKGSFFGMLALRDGSLLVYGLRGNVFRSSDAGATWTASVTGSQAALLGSALLADGGVLLGGQSGALLLSRDQGQTFQLQHHPERKLVAAIQVAGNNRLLFGEAGVSRFALR